MDPDLGIGPMEHRFPTQKVRIFHVGKSILDLRLTTIGQHDLFVAPAMLVGEEDAFPQVLLFNSGKGGSIGSIAELQLAADFAYGDVQDLGDVLAGTDFLQLFREAFLTVPLSFGPGLLRAPQFGLQLF